MFTWADSFKIDELIKGKNQLLENLNDLSGQIKEYQKQIDAKDEKLYELERDASALKIISGNISMVFSGNWVNQPWDITPLGWNKAQPYVYFLINKYDSRSSIPLYLESLEFNKVDNNRLEMKLNVESRSFNFLDEKSINVLADYTGILVNLPFLDKDSTNDQKIFLNKIQAHFIINGYRNIHFETESNFEIRVFDDHKNPQFQYNKEDMFSELFIDPK